MFKFSVMLPYSLCHSKHKATFRAEAESIGHLYLHKHDQNTIVRRDHKSGAKSAHVYVPNPVVGHTEDSVTLSPKRLLLLRKLHLNPSSFFGHLGHDPHVADVS